MDELSIAALFYRFARAVDTKDWERASRRSYGACTTSPTSKATSTATPHELRAMFYNPMQLPGMAELSYCAGYYHHELVRTPDGWRSRQLREENVWFANSPAVAPH
jgi:hypothetical protein